MKAPANDVWAVVADQFTSNDKWMAQVFETEGSKAKAGDLDARVCQLTPTLDGLNTYEEVIEYDKENYRFVFTVIVRGGGKFPVKRNVATVTLEDMGTETLVRWETKPELKPVGYLIIPLLKAGIQKSFREVLEELKYYVEEGKPHPRKVEAMKKLKK